MDEMIVTVPQKQEPIPKERFERETGRRRAGAVRNRRTRSLTRLPGVMAARQSEQKRGITYELPRQGYWLDIDLATPIIFGLSERLWVAKT